MSAARAPLVLAIPSKGALHERTLRFLQECDLRVESVGHDREYRARLRGADGVQVLLLRADEIPARVGAGAAHAGITGEDLVREHGEGDQAGHVLVRLGYGQARLVVAVPRAWLDVDSALDLEEVAAAERQRRGHALRVATKFPRLTREFFAEHGIADYVIVQSLGATEGAPAAGAADVIVDLSSTGATLAQNHLKEIAGGTLLASQACVLASTRAAWSGPALDALERLVELFEARLRAAGHAQLRARVAAGAAGTLAAEIAALGGTAHLMRDGGDGVDVEALCPSAQTHAVAARLRAAGAAQVAASRPELVFAGPPQTVRAFRLLLRRVHDAGPETPA